MRKLKCVFPKHLHRAQLRGLYVVTEAIPKGNENDDGISHHERIARAAIAGGASIIQLRDKSTPLPHLYQIAFRLRRLTREAGVLFLINDRPDLALACDADGVHLGPDDLPPAAARRVLGTHRLIGVSCGNVTELRHALQQSADYIGAGAIFSTTTKLDAGVPIGLDALRAIVSTSPLPVAAIGGINLQNIEAVAACGATMACVVSAVSRAGDESTMAEAACELTTRFNCAFR